MTGANLVKRSQSIIIGVALLVASILVYALAD